jgi:3-deoxy-D-arabino-heptulosonate 7-phosphate (DAHP) synthase
MQARVQEGPDFWSVAGLSELAMLEAVGARTAEGRAARALAAALPAISASFAELQGRVQARWKWASVADQAHFVLTPYQRAGSAEERAAAQALMDQLRAYATGG